MQKLGTSRAGLLVGAALAIGLIAAFVIGSSGASAAPAAGESSRVVAKSAKNKTLGKTVLVTPRGMTLYSLTVETHGKFICTTKFCLSLWTPLIVPRGTTPTGAHLLGTIKRPDDGRTQVTYRGRPLYTFNEDTKPGDVKGNGFKDVGTWLAATPTAAKSVAPPSSSGYSY
jgi:predicted lipoprotein with Yx(FWY)xxD motif